MYGLSWDALALRPEARPRTTAKGRGGGKGGGSGGLKNSGHRGPHPPPLHTIRDTVLLAGPRLPGVAEPSPFPTQAQFHRVSTLSRGARTRLVSPMPVQVVKLAGHRERRVISKLAGPKVLCKELQGVSISSSPMGI